MEGDVQSPQSESRGKTLAALVQQIGEIIQQGEDSITPTQHTESQEKLRSIFLTLLDVSLVVSQTGGRQLDGVLQLLVLTLEKVPGWVSGENNSLLLEMLDRLIPLLSRRLEPKTSKDFVRVLTGIFFRIAATDDEQFASLLRIWWRLFEDAYRSAILLSVHGVSQQAIECPLISRLSSAAPDSKEGKLEFTIHDLESSEHMLVCIMKVFYKCTEAQPLGFMSNPPPAVIEGALLLLESNSLYVQSETMRWIAVLTRSGPEVPWKVSTLLQCMKSMIREYQESSLDTREELPKMLVKEWCQNLVGLIQSLFDVLKASDCIGQLSEVVVHGLEVNLESEAHEIMCGIFLEICVTGNEGIYALSTLLSRFERYSIKVKKTSLEAVYSCLSRFTECDVQHALTKAFEYFVVQPRYHQNNELESRKDLNEGLDLFKSHESHAHTYHFEKKAKSDSILFFLCTGLNSAARNIMCKLRKQDEIDFVSYEELCIFAELCEIVLQFNPLIAFHLTHHALINMTGFSLIADQSKQKYSSQTIQASIRTMELVQNPHLNNAIDMACILIKSSLAAEMNSESCISSSDFKELCLAGAKRKDALSGIWAIVGALWIACKSKTKDDFNFLLKLFKGSLSDPSKPILAACGILLPTAIVLSGTKSDESSSRVSRPKKHPSSPVSNAQEQLQRQLISLIRVAEDESVIKSIIYGLSIVFTHLSNVWSMVSECAGMVIGRCSRSPFGIKQEGSKGSSDIEIETKHSIECIYVGTMEAFHEVIKELLDKLEDHQPGSSSGNEVTDSFRNTGFVQLVSVVNRYFASNPNDQFKHNSAIAMWLISQATSKNQLLRKTVLDSTPSIASPSFLISGFSAICDQPTPGGRHRVAGELALFAMKNIGNQMKTAGSYALSFLEDALQLIAYLGTQFFDVESARSLAVGMLVLGIDQKDAGVAGFAAELLKNMAQICSTSSLELILSNSGVAGTIASRVASSSSFLQEVADVVGMKKRALAATLVPIALEVLLESKNTVGLKSLASDAGIPEKQIFKKYGHIPFASILIRKAKISMGQFMELYELWSGEDFVAFAGSVLPQTLTQLISQAGEAPEWNDGDDKVTDMVYHIAKVVNTLADTAAGELKEDTSNSPHNRLQKATEFLAEGDHITRMLKEFGDQLVEYLDPEYSDRPTRMEYTNGLKTLRAIVILLALSDHVVDRFLPQFMVLLGASIRFDNHLIKLEGLKGWKRLVDALSIHANIALGGVVDQIVVTLLDSLQEPGDVGQVAAEVIHSIIESCKKSFPSKLQTIPPLPQWSASLQEINEQLHSARGDLTTSEQVVLLLDSLSHEALSVRSISLRQLQNLLSTRRDWLSKMQRTSTSDTSSRIMLRRLAGALLKCIEPDASSPQAKAAQQACAECLGMIGALDPNLVALQPQQKPCRAIDVLDLAQELLLTHLLRLLKTAPSLQELDMTTLAIQDVLRCYNDEKKGNSYGKRSASSRPEPHRTENNTLFNVLPEEVQAIVRPYLFSRYSIRTSRKRKTQDSVVFQPGISFRRWIGLWLTALIEEHCAGEYLNLFKAASSAIRIDVSLAMFIAPYIVRNAVVSGRSIAVHDIKSEVLAVLEHKVSTRDGILCMQSIFSLLDVLHWWNINDSAAYVSKLNPKLAGSSKAKEDHCNEETLEVEALLDSIPKDTLARAASSCGGHARALLYYETYLLSSRGGLNPAAATVKPGFQDEEVSFLLEIYSRLEEPDGLDGLIKLRRGIPHPADQRLVAEKAGSWAEALNLYERELVKINSSKEACSERTKDEELEIQNLHHGYLNCLLEMGHWQGLLTQVEGLASARLNYNCSKILTVSDAPYLASMGSAAAWRLGWWKQLQQYLKIAQNELYSLDSQSRWEVRIGGLLLCGFDLYSNLRNGVQSSHLLEGLSSAFNSELSATRAEVMEAFSAAAMESYSRAYPQLVKLHMIQEIADVVHLIGRGSDVGPKERQRTLRWEERISLTQRSLTTQAPILALRRQLAQLIDSSDEAGNCWLQQAELCRDTGHLDAAASAVLEASNSGVIAATMEQVHLFHCKGEYHRALVELHNLDYMVSDRYKNESKAAVVDDLLRYRANVVLQLAELKAETGQGASDEIIQHFEHALQLRKGWEKALFHYAVYLDHLMQDAKARQELAAEEGGNQTIDRLGGKSRIRLGEDRPYLEFLPEVMRNYARAIISGYEHVHRALPRLLTLWYDFGSEASEAENGSREQIVEPHIMEIMQQSSRNIPIHCWMTALPQLISRLLHPNNKVASLTREIVTQTTVNYPQQALWALAVVSKSAVSARRVAANSIISNAKRAVANPEIVALFSNHNSVCEQLIKVCHQKVGQSKKPLSVKRDFRHFHELLRRSGVMVPIMSSLTPILPPKGSVNKDNWQPFGDSCIVISDVDDVIDIMSSLQKPKRIVLIGSDGNRYPFLAKPKDDLRKDNRMMEAAGVLNRLFQEESVSRRRGLMIRRFAVTPITEDCGIVEWVGNTKPVRHCIQDIWAQHVNIGQDNNKIKLLYDEYTSMRTRSSSGRPAGVDALVAWLDQVLKTRPPVLHKWFLGKFADPAAWFNGRLAYTRTYAVWCMVGHITGLGDRHGENILLDMGCGDAIHIDFGCLFDKGLVLEKPEMVPFRLTQNIIDGFGVSGLEGVFRKSCEITLGVLRKHRETIMPIMETFLHDPLVDWHRKNNLVNTSIQLHDNPMAKDALVTIDGRLKGTLLGVASKPCMAMSVSGHAASLIQEAVNKENLAKMYIWWQAWY